MRKALRDYGPWIVGAFLLGFLGYYLFFHPVQPSVLTPEEKSWLAQKGELVIAGQDVPPFEFFNQEGEYEGLGVDLVNDLASVLDSPIRLVHLGRSEVLQALGEGRVDALLDVPNFEATTDYDLTGAYLKSNLALFVPSNREDIQSLEDLDEARIAVEMDGPAQWFLATRGVSPAVLVDSLSAGMAAIRSGEADAFLGDAIAGRYALEAGDGIKMAGEPLARLDYSLAVAKGNSVLLSILNRGLGVVSAQGRLAGIEQEWLGGSDVPSPSGQAEVPLIPLAAFLLGALLVYLWARPSLREVDRKRRELFSWREKFKVLMDNTNDAIFTLNPVDGSLLEVNPKMEGLTGYWRDELLTMSMERLLALKDRRRAVEGLKDALVSGSGRIEDLNLLRKDGSSLSVDISANVVSHDGRKVIQCTARDVTERKRMRHELLQRTEDLSAINAIGTMVSRFVDLEEVLSQVLGKVMELMKMEAGSIFLAEWGGLRPSVQVGEVPEVEEGSRLAEEVVEKGEVLLVSDLATDPQLVGMKARRGGLGCLASVPLKSKDKVQGVMNLYGRAMHQFDDEDKRLLEAIGNQIGVAVEMALLFQKVNKTVSELSGMKQFNESVLQSMSDGLLAVSMRGVITLANRAAERILGYKRGELGGKTVREVLGDGEVVVKEGLDRGTVIVRKEIEVKKGKGTVPIGVSVSPLRGEGRIRGAVVLFGDLSEARAMEEEKRRLDRLALLGEMSAVVAHEVRNPLAGIGAGIQHIARKVRDGDENYESIQMILRESERVNRIIEDILTVSRPIRLNLGPCDIKEVVEEVLGRFAERCEEHRVLVSKYYGPELPVVKGDAVRLNQALSNIILNGIEAMPDGGELRVGVAHYGDKKQVEIEVKDSGAGIREEDLRRLFEPFWTTKAGGTGLGLAIAKRIIEEHGGKIEVSSQEGRGTTFKIRLPLAK